MTRFEGLFAGVTTAVMYMLTPDDMNHIQTILFLIVMFGLMTTVIWSAEELYHRIRLARRISRKKRTLVNIEFRRGENGEI